MESNELLAQARLLKAGESLGIPLLPENAQIIEEVFANCPADLVLGQDDRLGVMTITRRDTADTK